MIATKLMYIATYIQDQTNPDIVYTYIHSKTMLVESHDKNRKLHYI